MESPEGKGIARRAWDAYSGAIENSPVAQTLARKMAIPVSTDLLGFWMLWHLEGGFEGMRRLGMSRATIYRRIKMFRTLMASPPTEYPLPPLTPDPPAHPPPPPP